ncbi:MAG: hypothetical protein NTZ97_02485 [Candidatus Moranbacteria bacterium]|nr:hypothetical protein [Candidatus Moranbacteria bacterium]
MNKVNEKYEDLAKKLREEIRNFAPHYRCHEGARIIQKKLKSLEIKAKVRDGGVIYDSSLFARDMEDFCSEIMASFQNLPETERKRLEKELRAGEEIEKMAILHSWCEFKNNGDTIVIDWHATLKPTSDCGIQNILIIESKNKLPHRYVPMGIKIWKWIIFPLLPPQVVRLRI